MDFCLNLDSSKRKITFGGYLTARAESEVLAKKFNFKNFFIKFSNYLSISEKQFIWDVVFKESKIDFHLLENKKPPSFLWPSDQVVKGNSFEYHSFKRLSYLYSKYKIPPRLTWKKDFLHSSKKNLPNKTKLVFAHLKSVYPFKKNESNVKWDIWESFFNLSRINFPDISFFLIGDDEVEIDLSSIPNVVSAKEYDLNLTQQLALVSKSYGFIGMASGISSAANFSDIPYVIIKDPSHHSDEMEEELGKGDSFNFSCESQFLWRKQQSVDLLNNALKLINEQNKS